MAETTVRENPYLRGIIKAEGDDGKTHRVASWLLEQLNRLGDADPGYVEYALYLARDKVRNPLSEYTEVKDDPERRRDPHRRLINATKTALEELCKCLALKMPTTKQKIEETITSNLRHKSYSTYCNICGNIGKNYPKEGANANVCKSCTDEHFFKCKKCDRLQGNDKARMYMDDMSPFEPEQKCCYDCIPQEWTCCVRCGSLHSGNYARGVPLHPTVTQDEVARISCARCAPAFTRKDCGHVCHENHKVRGKMPCLEDDAVEAPDKQKFCCRNCYRDQRVPRRADAEHWESYKDKYGSRKSREVGSTRTYGVEIEVCEVLDFSALDEDMREIWSSKHDASLPQTGVEFASTVLRGDAGLDAIRKFCALAKKEEWGLNEKAGLHLHIGLGDMPVEQRLAINMGYQMSIGVWQALCAPSRTYKNKYCIKHYHTPEQFLMADQVEAWSWITSYCIDRARRDGGNERNGRRHWINWLSFIGLRTLEIRLHQGTLNADKIVNWVKAHARMVDWCVSQGTAKEVYNSMHIARTSGKKMLEFLTEMVWKDRALGNWFSDRAKTLHGGKCCIHHPTKEIPSAPYGHMPNGYTTVADRGTYAVIGDATAAPDPITFARPMTAAEVMAAMTAQTGPHWGNFTMTAPPEDEEVPDEEPEYEEEDEEDEEEDA